jgi:hypothetical protein
VLLLGLLKGISKLEIDPFMLTTLATSAAASSTTMTTTPMKEAKLTPCVAAAPE